MCRRKETMAIKVKKGDKLANHLGGLPVTYLGIHAGEHQRAAVPQVQW